MALFVIQHKHTEESCPARDPEKSGMLVEHLSAENAESYGLDIKCEAVINGKHTLYLMVEAESEQQIQEFMAPFSKAGSVEVMQASSCEVVIERGTC